MKWLVLSLEFGAPDDVLRWASDVITEHSDHRVILDTHSYTAGDKRVDPLNEPLTGENSGWGYGLREDPRNVNGGEDIWRELVSKHPNVIFTFSGHNFLDGAETVVSETDGGGRVFQSFVNYQNGISGEITGAGDPEFGGRAGNGALRLFVVDPEAGRISTHTKFTGFDAYFERVDHQEVFEDVDLGAPEQIALAEAGENLVVEAEEGGTAVVTLDPGTRGDVEGVSYEWFDARGDLIGRTDGAALDVALGYGTHRLTLVVTDAGGNESHDETSVVVGAKGAKLLENFDDGDSEGWGAPSDEVSDFARVGTDVSLGLPAIAGAAQVPLTLSFDSHWRSYDNMTGEVLVSFDGAKPVRILQFDSSNTTDTDQRDSRVAVDFLAPADAGEVSFSFRISDADNDWYWAIDNIALTDAEGTVLGSEDFEGLRDALRSAADEAIPDNVLGWTHETPEGWSRSVSEDTAPGTAEWRGWSFATKEFWTAADGQARSEFTRGSGVIAIADPDEWDDYNGGAAAPDSFDSTITTPSFKLEQGEAVDEGRRAGVLSVDALSKEEQVLVRPGGGEIREYSLVYDLYVPKGHGTYTSLLQTDPANRDDADLYLENRGDGTAGIGTLGQYDGEFAYGAWNRVGLSVSVEDGAHVLRTYVDGALAGTHTVDGDVSDGSRWTINGSEGFLLFGEPGGYTTPAFLNSFAFTPEVLSEVAIAEMGKVDLDGPMAGSETEGAFQLNFEGALDATDFGQVEISTGFAADAASSYLVKGSIFQNPNGEGEAALYQQSDGVNEILVWEGTGAAQWSDYVYDVVVHPTDNDTIGAVFYWQDVENHYEVTLDTQTNERVLTRVSGGERTELAREEGGYRHHVAQDLRIAVTDGEITVSLNDKVLFDGAVSDPDALSGGSVGALSRNMDRAHFDDIAVNPVGLQATASAPRTALDHDGDGTATVEVSAEASVTSGATSFEWLVGDEVVATGRTADIDLVPGARGISLRATGENGIVSEDMVGVDVTPGSSVALVEDFSGQTLPEGWTIVDQGTQNGPSEWSIRDGALHQASEIGSDQQEAGWDAWSEAGEGAYILRDGTQAVYDAAETENWEDYVVRAEVAAPGEGAVGLKFHYEDAENHYKLELDDRTGTIQLSKHVDGYETLLARAWSNYTPDEAMDWRIAVEDGHISAQIDGEAVFGSDIFDQDLGRGGVGLYTWEAGGTSFDDVSVALRDRGLPLVAGTSDRDSLSGTAADELIRGNGGRLDLLGGGGGADTFDFAGLGDNAIRDTTRILDWEEDDAIVGLRPAGIVSERSAGDRLLLGYGEDNDVLIVTGADSAEDLFGLTV